MHIHPAAQSFLAIQIWTPTDCEKHGVLLRVVVVDSTSCVLPNESDRAAVMFVSL